MANLAVIEPGDRLRAYLDALAYYSSTLPRSLSGIVFAENSGADQSLFLQALQGPVPFEMVSVPALHSTVPVGRAYQEIQLISSALNKSAMLRDADARILKVTGRYKLLNLAAAARSITTVADLAFNTRLIPKPWVDMWTFGASRRGLEFLARHSEALKQNHASSTSPEEMLAQLIPQGVSEGLSVQRRFPFEPRFAGVRGYDGRDYRSIPQSAKWAIRSTTKRVAPWLWI